MFIAIPIVRRLSSKRDSDLSAPLPPGRDQSRATPAGHGKRLARRNTSLVPVQLLLVLGGLASGFMIWVALDSHTYSDFAFVYDSAAAFHEGRSLYVSAITRPGWHNMNPPHFIALMAPLAWLPIRSAMILWWIVTGVAMLACVRMWQRWLPPGWALALFALLMASAAGYLNIRAANQTWVFAAIVTAGWSAWREGSARRAAAILGFAASIKLFLLIVLPYLAWRRRWGAVASFVGAIAVAVATGIGICGLGAYAAWLRGLSDQTWQGSPLSMSMLGGLTRAFDAYSSAAIVDAPRVITPFWVAITAGLGLVLYGGLRREHTDRDFAALLVAMLLITPAGWIYYIPLFAGPAAATLARSRSSWLWIASVLALLVPYPFVAAASGSPLVLLSLGSIYLWGGVALLAAILLTNNDGVAAPSDAVV